MQVKVINKSKHPLPQYETIASAGMDVRANIDQSITLEPLGRSLVKTGLFMDVCRYNLQTNNMFSRSKSLSVCF